MLARDKDSIHVFPEASLHVGDGGIKHNITGLANVENEAISFKYVFTQQSVFWIIIFQYNMHTSEEDKCLMVEGFAFDYFGMNT